MPIKTNIRIIITRHQATLSLWWNARSHPTIALTLFATTPVAAGAWEDGLAARAAGDYQKAVRLFEPLAERRNVAAQQMLALMYSQGKGVSKDDAKAAYWWTKAAKQGSAMAQTNLAMRYMEGKGVPENDVRAYAWSSIAAAQGGPIAPMIKETAAKSMTPTQIAEAQKLSLELWEKYIVPFQKK